MELTQLRIYDSEPTAPPSAPVDILRQALPTSSSSTLDAVYILEPFAPQDLGPIRCSDHIGAGFSNVGIKNEKQYMRPQEGDWEWDISRE